MCVGCSWRLVEAANGIANALPQDSSLLNGKNFVDWLFDYAVAHKLKVVRMFGFGDVQDGQGAALESSSGEHPLDQLSLQCVVNIRTRLLFDDETKAPVDTAEYASIFNVPDEQCEFQSFRLIHTQAAHELVQVPLMSKSSKALIRFWIQQQNMISR